MAADQAQDAQDRTDPPDKLYVTAKAVVRRGDALLLLEERLPDGRTVLDLPGGRLDVGEDVRAGLERELAEELGVGARSIGALPVKVWTAVNGRGDGVVALAYEVELETGDRTDAFDHTASPEVLAARFVTAAEHAAAPDFLHRPAIDELLAG